MKAAKENNINRYNVNLSTNTQVKDWLNIGTKVMYVEKEYTYPYGYILRHALPYFFSLWYFRWQQTR